AGPETPPPSRPVERRQLGEALACTERDAGEPGLRNHNRQFDFRLQHLVDPAQQSTAAYEDKAATSEVGGKLGWVAFQRLFGGVDDLGKRPPLIGVRLFCGHAHSVYE